MCYVCGWQNQGSAAPVLLLVCFVASTIPSLVVCAGWLPVHQGPPQLPQTAMCQFYCSDCCLTQWGKAALLLPLALILLPTKFLSSIHYFSFCPLSFSCSSSLPASLSLTRSPVFSLLGILSGSQAPCGLHTSK